MERVKLHEGPLVRCTIFESIPITLRSRILKSEFRFDLTNLTVFWNLVLKIRKIVFDSRIRIKIFPKNAAIIEETRLN